MLKRGTIIGDIVETAREQGVNVVKEVASAPVDIVKASFKAPKEK